MKILVCFILFFFVSITHSKNISDKKIFFLIDWTADGTKVLTGHRMFGIEGGEGFEFRIYDLPNRNITRISQKHGGGGAQRDITDAGFKFKLRPKAYESKLGDYFEKQNLALTENQVSKDKSESYLKLVSPKADYQFFSKNNKDIFAISSGPNSTRISFGLATEKETTFVSEIHVACERGLKHTCEMLLMESMNGDLNIENHVDSLLEKFGPKCLADRNSNLCKLVDLIISELVKSYKYCNFEKSKLERIRKIFESHSTLLSTRDSMASKNQVKVKFLAECEEKRTPATCTPAYKAALFDNDKAAIDKISNIYLLPVEKNCPTYKAACQDLRLHIESIFQPCTLDEKIKKADSLVKANYACQNFSKDHPDKIRLCAIASKLDTFYRKPNLSSKVTIDPHSNSLTRIECLKAIKDKSYTNLDIRFCMDESSSTNRLICLQSLGIANKEKTCTLSQESPRSGFVRNENGRIRPKVLENEVGEKKQFSPLALSVCNDLATKGLRVACKNEIADSCFDTAAVDMCFKIKKTEP